MQLILAIEFKRKLRQDDHINPESKGRQFREYARDLAAYLASKDILMIGLMKNPKIKLPPEKMERYGYEYGYIGGGVFSEYYTIDHKTGCWTLKKATICPDLIYSRNRIFYDDGFLNIVNNVKFDTLTINKWSQFCLFRDIQPKSFIALSQKEILQHFSNIEGSLVVVKPLSLTGGHGIFIGKKSDFPTFSHYPAIVQEFHESINGIPNLATGRHDIRILMIDGKPIAMAVREPLPNSLLSNTHQGGTIRFVHKSNIPSSLKPHLKIIKERLHPYGSNFCSADFLFDGKNWMLIEINGKPGIPALFQDTGDGAVLDIYSNLSTWFLSHANQQTSIAPHHLIK